MKIFMYIFFSHLFLNALIYYYFNFLKDKININDYPDNKNKLHKIAIPLMGGWILMFNIILFFILNYSNLVSTEKNIMICCFLFLLVGIVDDKYNLSPYTKIFFLTSFLTVFFIFSEGMVIKNLSIFNHNIYLTGIVGIFFSTLCVLLFVNAFNLFDGINLQSILYGVYFLLYLFFKNLFIEIIFSIIISLIFVAYLNYKNKIFMGNSGTLFLGSLISLLVIANYTNENSFKTEEIFLLMLIPGVDMFRLFLQRILNRKNPFLGDREHLHHYLLQLYGYKFAIISILSISILPSILNLYIESNIVIFIFINFYLFLLIFLKKQIN